MVYNGKRWMCYNAKLSRQNGPYNRWAVQKQLNQLQCCLEG